MPQLQSWVPISGFRIWLFNMHTEILNDGILSMRDRKEEWIFLLQKLFLEPPDGAWQTICRGIGGTVESSWVNDSWSSTQEGCTWSRCLTAFPLWVTDCVPVGFLEWNIWWSCWQTSFPLFPSFLYSSSLYKGRRHAVAPNHGFGKKGRANLGLDICKWSWPSANMLPVWIIYTIKGNNLIASYSFSAFVKSKTNVYL